MRRAVSRARSLIKLRLFITPDFFSPFIILRRSTTVERAGSSTIFSPHAFHRLV